MIAYLIVAFYRFWHGKLHLKGAGILIRVLAPHLHDLHNFPIKLQEGQIIHVDFRDVSAVYWLNATLGDPFEEEGLLSAVLSESTEDSVVWDVGANCGLFTYRLAQNAKFKSIVFFPSLDRFR